MARIKYVTRDSTVSGISDAFSTLEELGSEARELYDNASEGLQQTQRIQTFEETAGTLEGLSEPDVPACIADLPISYSEQTSKRGLGRARRCQNAIGVLQAAAEAAQTWLDEHPVIDDDEPCEGCGRSPGFNLGAGCEKCADLGDGMAYSNDDRDEVDTFISELENAISDAEGCEFPGMFG